jgi:hypothetical protein
MVVAARAIAEATVDVRRDRVGALTGIKALLLPQSFFKVGSRRPEREQRLPILVVDDRKRRLLLQQITQQNPLLRIGIGLIA